MTAERQARVVFVSYAHEDSDLLERLRVVLKPLISAGSVDMWTDLQIGVARRWNDEIEANLRRAEVAVLLVSADFLASDYITGVELPRLSERKIPLVCVPAGDPSQVASTSKGSACVAVPHEPRANVALATIDPLGFHQVSTPR